MRQTLFLLSLHEMLFQFSINALDELAEQQTKELKSLEEKCVDLTAQINSHEKLEAERETQR